MDHGLSVKCKTIKFLEDNKGENLDDFEYGNDSLDATPKTMICESNNF